jgi:hypothetical protein
MSFNPLKSFVDSAVPSVGSFIGDLANDVGVSISDPVKIFTEAIQNPASVVSSLFSILPLPKISVPNPLEFIKETIKSIAQIFKGLIDSVVDKIDYVISSNIGKLQEAGVTIANKFESVANNIINNASAGYKDLLQKTINELKSIIETTFQEVRNLLQQADKIVEARINQVGNIVVSSLETITKIADTYAPGKIMNDLVTPTLAQIGMLEKQLFADVNQVLDKVFDKIDQKSEEFKKREKLIAFAFRPKLANEVLKELNLSMPDLYASEMSYYNFLKAYSLKLIERDGTITIDERLQAYAEIQENAAILSFLKVVPSVGSDYFAREFMNYGLLYRETEKFLP